MPKKDIFKVSKKFKNEVLKFMKSEEKSFTSAEIHFGLIQNGIKSHMKDIYNAIHILREEKLIEIDNFGETMEDRFNRVAGYVLGLSVEPIKFHAI